MAAVSLLTIPETAVRLRCSRAHVYRLIAKGQLRTKNIAEPGSRRPKTRVTADGLAVYISR